MAQQNKIVIFGTGQLVQKNIAQIKLLDVIAFADNNKKLQGENLNGKHIIAPEQLKNIEFDYIIVFSNKYFQEIFDQLYYDLCIPMDKIIGWGFLFNFLNEEKATFRNYSGINELITVLKELSCFSIMDIDYGIGKNYYFCKDHKALFKGNSVVIDTIDQPILNSFPIYKNIYSNRYTENLIIQKKYDAIIFVDYKKYSGIEDYIKCIRKRKISAKYYILYLPHPYGERNHRRFQMNFSKWGCAKKIVFSHGYIIIIQEKSEPIKFDLQLYIVTHKLFIPPKDKIRLPIQAGNNGSTNLGYIRDDSGENISELNPYINECTALYWIWKNAVSKYIGLEHYRRYFLNNGITSRTNLLTKEHIAMLLEDYDIILVQAITVYPITVGTSVMLDTDKDLYDKAYAVIRGLINERHPEYIEAFDYVMSGYVFFKCNMFITSKEIMDNYCSWLFSFIIDAAKTVDVKDYSAHNQRIVGFFAERLLTVWLMKQDFHIKEMPILEIK